MAAEYEDLRRQRLAEARRNFQKYAGMSHDRLLSIRPQMDGSDVKRADDLRKYPLAYGITHRGELRRFANRMLELHRSEGIEKVIEIVDDVNYGLPQESATVITLHQAAALGRSIYFNLNFLDDLPAILNDKGKYASNLTAMELRYIRQHWGLFGDIITFWKNDEQVPPPWDPEASEGPE
jgi:hypothetical protein